MRLHRQHAGEVIAVSDAKAIRGIARRLLSAKRLEVFANVTVAAASSNSSLVRRSINRTSAATSPLSRLLLNFGGQALNAVHFAMSGFLHAAAQQRAAAAR